MTQTADVIVVGAGLSGLTAAWRLGWAGKTVCVLDAAPRLGGRIRSAQLADGQWLELGAAGIGARQTRLRQLVGELGLELEAATPPLDAAAPFAAALAALPWPARHQLQRLWARLERQAAALPPEPAPEHALAQRLARQPLADWLQDAWLGRRARRLAGEMAAQLFGAAPDELSALDALLQLRRHGGRQALAERRFGAAQARPQGGMQALCAGLAVRLGDSLLLETPLFGLRQDAQAVELFTPRGRLRAARVVLALPALQLAGLACLPAQPGWRDHGLRHLLPQASLEAYLSYERAFWRERLPTVALPRAAGDCLILEQPPLGAGGALRVRLGGAAAQRASGLDAAARRELLLEILAGVLGEAARAPQELLLQHWADEPYLRCAEPRWARGPWLLQGAALRRPLGRVHFAGADLAPRWPGTLEGAVEAGELAAEEVLRLG